MVVSPQVDTVSLMYALDTKKISQVSTSLICTSFNLVSLDSHKIAFFQLWERNLTVTSLMWQI